MTRCPRRTVTRHVFLVAAAAVLLAMASTVSAQVAAVQRGGTLATYGLTPGWATFGLALPKGAAPDGVQVGSLPTQTDVKTTWKDGSIRFAVITAQVDKAGQFAITAAPRPGGTLAPVWPQAEVVFTIAGQPWTAVLPRPTADRWLNGPLVHEARAIVAPMSGGRPHVSLRVVFDLRMYRDGTGRLDVAVENALNVADADKVDYNVDVRVDGASRFSRAGLTHYYLGRWRATVGLRLAASTVTPDFTPFIQARAVPRYKANVDAPAYRVTGEQFDIMRTGDLHLPMNDHGGRPELAPYPDWTAQYLVHRRPDQLAYMLAHGNLAGSFGIHIKEPDGVRLISIDDHPNFWLDARADGDGRPQNGLRGQSYGADIAHQPSLAFVPYLVTGDRYFADEVAYWANFCLIKTFQDAYYNIRGGSAGLLLDNEVRGIGWALRNLADTVYLPDDHPYRKYFFAKVKNNLVKLNQYANTYRTPLGALFAGKRPEDQDKPPYTWIALWEHTYLAWAVDRALQHGFSPGAALRNRVARFQLSLFTSSPAYPWKYGAPYILAIGIYENGKARFFTSLAEVFKATYGTPPAPPVSFAGYYGPETRLMLQVAAQNNWAGAAVALQQLETWGGSGVGSMDFDLRRRSGWAIERQGHTPERLDPFDDEPEAELAAGPASVTPPAVRGPYASPTR